MLLTVFDTKGIPALRRERIEAAVVNGARHVPEPCEAWIAAGAFRGGVKALITRPHGFRRTVVFALTEEAGIIAERVSETLEE